MHKKLIALMAICFIVSTIQIGACQWTVGDEWTTGSEWTIGEATMPDTSAPPSTGPSDFTHRVGSVRFFAYRGNQRLEGVKIKIYKKPDEYQGTYITDENGLADVDLAHGEYWYSASFGEETIDGDFFHIEFQKITLDFTTGVGRPIYTKKALMIGIFIVILLILMIAFAISKAL